MKIEQSCIYFNIEEAEAAEHAALEKFGHECAIIGLGDDFFKVVQHGDGVNATTSNIGNLADWWENAWNQAV